MAPIISIIKNIIGNSNDSLKKVKTMLLKTKPLKNSLQKDWFLFVYKNPSASKGHDDVPKKSVKLSYEYERAKAMAGLKMKVNEGPKLSQLYNMDFPQFLEDIKQKLYTKSAPSPKIPSWKTNRARISTQSIHIKTKNVINLLALAEGAASRLKRLEEVFDHLLQHPETKQSAVKSGAISILLMIRNQSRDASTKQLVRQTLSILGYADPPLSSGIRILSIDGGGMRGLAAIRMLEKLEELSGKRIIELFDFICGVSTGAIITCCLLPPNSMTLAEIKKLYHNLSSQVFSQSAILGTGKLVWSHAYYDTHLWEKLLESYVGNTRLLDSTKNENCPKVATVSTIINQSRVAPYIFRNYSSPYNQSSEYLGGCNHTMFEAVRASAAAPTIFEEFKIGDILHQDGGIIVNNPTAVAIHEARTLWPRERLNCVVSCGTGRISKLETEIKKDIKQSSSWKNIFDKILESATDTEAVHLMLNDLLTDDVYFRLNPHLSRKVTMDEVNASAISLLEDDTEMYFRRNKDKFQDIVEKLKYPRKATQKCFDQVNIKLKLLGY